MSNIPMNQSDAKVGLMPALANEAQDPNLLVKPASVNSSRGVALPSANSDDVLYVTDDEVSAGDRQSVLPLSPDRNVRVKLKGTCSIGDQLVLADTATEADKGKVRALPAASGTYYQYGVAEEAGVDGQIVLMRPVARRTVTV